MTANDTTMTEIPVDQLTPNPWNPNQMADEEYGELVAEVKHLGRLPKPIVVRPNGERARFDFEIEQLLAFPARVLIVESTWQTIEASEWRGKMKPQHVVGSLLSWIAQGLPVVIAGDHARAGRHVARLLFITARRRWREVRQFTELITDGTTNRGSVAAAR